MKIVLLGLATLLFLCSPAMAWNDKGHMVVAKLAWDKLTPPQRQAAITILKGHPHYAEFLAANRPDNFDEDTWVFLRAATWPDWIRRHHPEAHLSFPKWHYVNLPYVPVGSSLKESDFPAASPNVVDQIPIAAKKVKDGTAEDKAIYLCWLLHLVGDIHQPLHCAEMFSERFPEGDRGGNLLLVRIGNGRAQPLHPLWDGLFGKSTSWSSIQGTVTDVAKAEQDNQIQIDADLRSASTPEAWAGEGVAAAKKYAYLNGKLDVANSDDRPDLEDVPVVPRDYMTNAGAYARIAVAKAGHRLAESLFNAL
jgi:S1/P1 Nuclease